MSARVEITPIPQGDVLVYKYGVRLDKECTAAVLEQIVQARRLYNDLIAYMRQVVAARAAREIELAGDDAQKMQVAINMLTLQFKEAKAANDSARMEVVAAERRDAWGRLGAALKDVRAQHKAELKSYLDGIGRTSGDETYQLRCRAVSAGLGWGTANAIFESALRAFGERIKIGRAPEFVRGEDKTLDSLRLQFATAGGVSGERLMGGKNSELKLSPPDEYGARRYGVFSFRLGAARNDVWATGSIQFHRPLPDHAYVTSARLVRERVGKDFRYSLQLTVTLENAVTIAVPSERKPLAALHLGWAADESGRRIAGIADCADASVATVVQLPPDIEKNLIRASEIQGVRDAARDEIVGSIKTLNLAELDLPKPHLEEILAIRSLPSQHVSQRRLHMLYWNLVADNVADRFGWLNEWRKVDKLNHQAATHIVRRARGMRREFYKKMALDLVRQYRCIVIDSPDLKATAKRVNEKTGKKTELGRQARAGRVVAALYELIAAIRWAAARGNTAVVTLSGKMAETCSVCGAVGLTNIANTQYQDQECFNCGAIHNRKQNGAAVAWQLSIADVEVWIVESQCRRGQDLIEKRDSKQERLEKVAVKRRENRQAGGVRNFV